MWIYEYDDNTKLDVNQLKIAAEWFSKRLFDDFLDGTPFDLEDFYINDDHVYVHYSWQDYCMGCHMGTEYESYKIPNDIFFSDQSLSKWKNQENQKRKEQRKREQERNKKAEERKRKQQKEKRDLEEYKRLKAKYEGENQND